MFILNKHIYKWFLILMQNQMHNYSDAAFCWLTVLKRTMGIDFIDRCCNYSFIIRNICSSSTVLPSRHLHYKRSRSSRDEQGRMNALYIPSFSIGMKLCSFKVLTIKTQKWLFNCSLLLKIILLRTYSSYDKIILPRCE